MPNTTLFEDRWEGLVALKNSLEKHNIDESHYCHIKKALRWIHVSCWYNDSDENYLMWKAYGQGNEAIRVETTQTKLEKVYRASPFFYAGFLSEVKYLQVSNVESAVRVPSFIAPIGDKVPPYDNNGVNIVGLMPHLFVKYDPYHGENEVRLVCLNKDYQQVNKQPQNGIRLKPSNISDFIESIKLAPGASEEVLETVELVIERFAPEAKGKLTRSILDDSRPTVMNSLSSKRENNS